MSTPNILIVEDEPDLSRLVALHVADLGYEAREAGCLAAARIALRQRRADLVVLDLGLPDGDGLQLCRELRERADYTPLLILSARADETDRVVGLELGADDYLAKPFSVRELRARIGAILRRVALAGATAEAPPPCIEIDGLVLDREKRRVKVGGATVELTATEFDLLEHLASTPGRVFTRRQLLEQVWGQSAGGEHTVNAHVNRLRAKIEPEPERPHYVRTVWGVGYRFLDPREEA